MGRSSQTTVDTQGLRDHQGEPTPDGAVDDLTPEETIEAMEGMRAEIIRLGIERERDSREAMARERRLERDNETILSALTRRVAHNRALERAATSRPVLENSETTDNPNSLVAPFREARKTVHVGVNLFLERMRSEGPPPARASSGDGHGGIKNRKSVEDNAR